MGVHLIPLTNNRPDDYIDQLPSKLIINDLSDTTETHERVKSHLYIEMSGDIGLRPTCSCGATTIQAGIYGEAPPCKFCGTTPRLTMDKELQSTLFLRCPSAVKTLLLPSVVSVLNDEFTFGHFRVIEYLMNRRYRIPAITNVTSRRLIAKLKEDKIPRGYNYFVENLRDIVQYLCDFKTLKNPPVLEYLDTYKDQLYTNHIPFMSNLLFIMESSQGSTYYDATFTKISDAVISMIGIDSKRPTTQEDLTGKSLASISAFYDEHFSSMYNSRKGIFRQILYAGKGITAMRCVMTAVTEATRYDMLRLPWCPTVQTLSSHITSKLLHRGYTLNNAHGIIQEASHTYHPLVHEILTEMQHETGEIGFPTFIERYPILGAGSMNLMYGIVKTDPRDKSLGFPVISVRPSNMDFDGDESHAWIIDDKETVQLLKPLELHNVGLDRLRPDTLSRNIELTSPVVSNLFRYMEEGSNLVGSPEQVKNMQDLFGK